MRLCALFRRYSFLIAPTMLGMVFTSACADDSLPPVPTVATVVIAPPNLSLLVGQSQQLTATARDQAGGALPDRAVTWTSSDSAIAAVTAGGLASGVNFGSVIITAAVEGKTATAVVTVSRPLSTATFASVTAGGAHTCALTSVGAAYCWGRGESGQLGVPVPTAMCMTNVGLSPCSMTPIVVRGGLSFVRLAAGGAYTCGLVSDGTAFCWGQNTNGQLGDGTTTNRDAPAAVMTTLKFSSITTGVEHTCGLTREGVALCWGRNDRGQLGDGGIGPRTLPTAVATELRFRAITAGGSFIGQTCALTAGGAAYCWGDNERGQLGRGFADPLVPHPLPAPVIGDVAFTAISAGLGRHVCGLTSTGAAYCWGEGGFGALGNGTMFSDKTVPTRVSTSVPFAQIIPGGFIGHTCALTSAGIAWCWGENEVGAIGDGTTDDHDVPVLVTGGLTFVGMTAGFRHTCGITAGGAVYCWGSNGAGQLGINTNAQRSAPTRVVSQP